MGILGSKLKEVFESFLGGQQARLVMLGLDAAGKTTILYKIKLNEYIHTIPTLGFNVETVQPVKGVTFTVWDVGGQGKIRTLWHHYYRDVEGLIFVVDSSDTERLEEAREELYGILEANEMRDVPVVVLANKQDLPKALKPHQIIEGLHLNKLTKSHKWHVQASCANTGEGIYEGMDAMAGLVKQYKKSKR